MSHEGVSISHPEFKRGRFRELSEEGIKLNLSIVVGRLRDIMSASKKKMNPGEVVQLANALSGLTRIGLALESREQERQAIIEQVRGEFVIQARQLFQANPELARQVEEVMSSVQLVD
jgi:hypothetical protein